MKNEKPSEPTPDEMVTGWIKGAEQAEKASKKGGWDLSQSRAAVWSTIGIIFAVDICIIVFALWARQEATARWVTLTHGTLITQLVFIAIDLFLSISLLQGKGWARTWVMVRVVVGLLALGIIPLTQQIYRDLLILVGGCAAPILLLTGTSTRNRVAGSIALFVLFLLGAVIFL